MAPQPVGRRAVAVNSVSLSLGMAIIAMMIIATLSMLVAGFPIAVPAIVLGHVAAPAVTLRAITAAPAAFPDTGREAHE